ncbi:hypothetical protein RJ640_006655 [Escallonia rubra]|uniref:Calcineurin-like phosphoesterase domain-containing protein n=1 Tax=Escallonia rubra TaxID=112253 RepID=A0AA88RCG9_9ASTE|nr:hypothetical protein RJ640_006655 [Escallonia rubra]
MGRALRPLLILFVATVALIAYEDRVAIPSCNVVPGGGDLDEGHVHGGDRPGDLKVMMVANLMLLGSEAGYKNTLFRDQYLSKFFKWIGDLSEIDFEESEAQRVVMFVALWRFIANAWPDFMRRKNLCPGCLGDGRLAAMVGSFVQGFSYAEGSFNQKSFEILTPDLLLVLGDLSARGAELTISKWSSVLQKFHSLLGPFLGLPFQIILGDRDMGKCSGLNAGSVRIARNFPGLDSAGCGAFEISNISFVSLNTVALLCGNNELRHSVEKAVEQESIELRTKSKHMKEVVNESGEIRSPESEVGWRENAMSSGSGPVLLLHFPLHHTAKNHWRGNVKTSDGSCESAKASESRGLVGAGPYALSQTLPKNATEYIFQALRPRIVFSAHTHNFCDNTHPDGTREITVPAMSWDARNDPGFVVATFRSSGKAVTVSHCLLARESDVRGRGVAIGWGVAGGGGDGVGKRMEGVSSETERGSQRRRRGRRGGGGRGRLPS